MVIGPPNRALARMLVELTYLELVTWVLSFNRRVRP